MGNLIDHLVKPISCINLDLFHSTITIILLLIPLQILMLNLLVKMLIMQMRPTRCLCNLITMAKHLVGKKLFFGFFLFFSRFFGLTILPDRRSTLNYKLLPKKFFSAFKTG